MEQRKELAYERHPLPSRFWEPEPDEEIVLPEPAETDETLTEEQRLQLELKRLQTESEQSPSD